MITNYVTADFVMAIAIVAMLNKKALLMPRAARDSISIREYWLPIAYDESGTPW